jgi:hypothetical protein
MYLCLRVLYPKSRARAKYRELKDTSNGTPIRDTTFYDDYLMVESKTDSTQIPYRDIQRVQTTETLVILHCPEGRAVLLDRGGFIDRTEEQVLARIRRYHLASS